MLYFTISGSKEASTVVVSEGDRSRLYDREHVSFSEVLRDVLSGDYVFEPEVSSGVSISDERSVGVTSSFIDFIEEESYRRTESSERDTWSDVVASSYVELAHKFFTSEELSVNERSAILSVALELDVGHSGGPVRPYDIQDAVDLFWFDRKSLWDA